MNPGKIAALIWDLSAWFFLLSVAVAPFVVLVQRCKARGKRKFALEPTERVRQLHPIADHSQDGIL